MYLACGGCGFLHPAGWFAAIRGDGNIPPCLPSHGWSAVGNIKRDIQMEGFSRVSVGQLGVGMLFVFMMSVGNDMRYHGTFV